MSNSVEFDERNHDRQGVNIEPYLKEAIDELLYDLFTGEKVGYPSCDLHDALQWLEEAGKLAPLCAEVLLGEEKTLKRSIEKELRNIFEESDTLYDRAEQLAKKEPDQDT